MPFKQSNSRFETNTEKGHARGTENTGGSVFPGPVLEKDGYTLWLEYVTDKGDADEWETEPLWLMWYDGKGKPTIAVSAVFDRSALATLGEHLLKAARL